MLNQPDPQGYLQHTQTQSQNVWDHTIWVSTTDIFSNYRKQVINSAGWAKLVTRHLSYLKLLYPHTWEANISNAHTLCEFRPDCTKFRPDCKVPSYPKSEKISKTEDMSKASSFKLGPNVHHPQEA
jgi:hypothetical protein